MAEPNFSVGTDYGNGNFDVEEGGVARRYKNRSPLEQTGERGIPPVRHVSEFDPMILCQEMASGRP
jgi:hypothetical protein